MGVKFVNLLAQIEEIRDEIDAALEEVITGTVGLINSNTNSRVPTSVWML